MITAIAFVLATSIARAQNDSATALFQRGDFSVAAAAYAAMLQSKPSDIDAQLGLASIRVFQNNLAAAKPLLQSVLASDQKNTRAARLLAEVERREAEAARHATIEGAQTFVPFVTADPLPVVRANVNGIAANLLVDTGGDVDLEPSLAAKAGVATVEAGMGNFAGGLQAPTRRGMLKSLALRLHGRFRRDEDRTGGRIDAQTTRYPPVNPTGLGGGKSSARIPREFSRTFAAPV